MCALLLVAGAFFPLALGTRLLRALGGQRRAIAWAASLQGRWARASLAAAGIALRVEGELPSGAHLVCANHQGYVDVLVLAASVPGRFVAMREIAGWPLFGWLARSSGTIFLDRGRRRDLLIVGPRIEETLAAGVNVLFFPEGRSGSGEGLRPLRSPLFEAAVRAGAPCLPVALRYATPGVPWSTAWTVAWWGGMGLPRHIARLLALPRVEACLRVAGPAVSGWDRKELAAAVARSLAAAAPTASLSPEPPNNPFSFARQ
jgi:1-acyl-sn-glycerol-3-phosphate acyltransferase